jgi:hypothetical protein
MQIQASVALAAAFKTIRVPTRSPRATKKEPVGRMIRGADGSLHFAPATNATGWRDHMSASARFGRSIDAGQPAAAPGRCGGTAQGARDYSDDALWNQRNTDWHAKDWHNKNWNNN